MDSVHPSAHQEPGNKPQGNASKWHGLFLLLSLALLLPSYTFWLNPRFDVLSNEFDFFIGQLPELFGNRPNLGLVAGKLFFALCYLGVAMTYWKWAKAIVAEDFSWGRLALMVLVPSLLYAGGIPWISPDVFYYLRGGWIETGYGLAPFQHAATTIPGYSNDPMFNNTYPAFLNFVGNYGPLFQKFCATVTALSGGEIKAALILFKVGCLVAHIGCTLMIVLLARKCGVSAKRAFFVYGCNPVILLVFLMCSHNDEMMMLPLLASALALLYGRPGWSGLLLACGFALKFVPLLILPVFGLFIVKNRRPARGLALFGMAFVAGSFLLYAMYPGSWEVFRKLASEGLPFYRTSSFTFFYGIFYLLGMNLQSFKWMVLGIFLVGSVLILGKPLVRQENLKPDEFLVLIMKIFLLYLLSYSTVVSEWYLAWIIPFVFFLPRVTGDRFLWLMTLPFTALVIFSVKTFNVLESLSQSLQYLVLLSAGILIFYPKITSSRLFLKHFTPRSEP